MEVLESDSELLFKSAFENASIGMALVSPDGTWLKVNKSLCEMTGYTRKELYRQTFQDISHPDDLQKDLFQLNRLLAGEGSSYELEKRYYHKNGKIIHAILSATLVRDEQDNPRFFISQIQDITQRKAYEKELLNQKIHYENIIKGTNAGIWQWEIPTGSMSVNDKLVNLLGYEKDEIDLSHISNWDEYLHPKDIKKIRGQLNEYFEEGAQDYEIEYRMRHKQGDWVWILSRGNSIKKNKAGRPIKMAGVHIDITLIKKIGKELRKSQERFKGIFNSTFQFIGFLSPQGVLMEANQTALEFGGILHADVVGKPFWEAHWWQISKDTQQKLKRSILTAAKGKTVKYEVEVWDKHKKPTTILFNLKPVFTQKKVTAIIAEGTPIQDLVDTRNKLLAKNLELENFTHLAAHDLKEPVRTVSNLLQVFSSLNKKDLDEKSMKILNSAVLTSERMVDLIDDLLTYTSSGLDKNHAKKRNFNEILEAVIASLESQIRDTNAVVDLKNIPEFEVEDFAYTLLFQNLINNAIKYRKSGVSPQIKIEYKALNQHHHYMISDNGIGIDAENHVKIFQMFKKLHSRSKYPGSGIGLATCKKIVDQLGGKINVKSAKNEGSTFTIIIPFLKKYNIKQD